MSKVFECDLPASEKFVLLAMADYASDSGDSIFPSIGTLAKKTSLSDRTVQTCIKSLIDKNYLIMAKNGGGRNHTNLYKIRCSRFTVTENGEIDDLKGETVALKGEATAPEPSLTISLNQTSLILPAKNAGKPEPILEPCNEDGVPDSWRESKSKNKVNINQDQQRLAGTISSLLGIKQPICNNKKDYAALQVTWWKPITEMLRQVDGDIEKAERIVDDVIVTYRAANLTMNSPKSLLNGFIGELVNHNKPRKVIGKTTEGFIYE